MYPGGIDLILTPLFQAAYTLEQLFAAGGILLFLFAIIIWVVLASRNQEETELFGGSKTGPQTVTHVESSESEKKLSSRIGAVRVLRGGAFIGNRLRFKVKVVNESQYTITDVKIHLVSYPRDALRFDSEDDDVYFSKVEPGGFRSPAFEFIPTQDCVKGEIVAGITYIDSRGKAHTQTTRPFEIRAVCDLLIPEKISPEAFKNALKGLHSGELVLSVDEWTPEEMFEKAQLMLQDANFHSVSSKYDQNDNVISAVIRGWARGKYTEKGVGVQLFISGPKAEKGACCTIRVSGEDLALVLPAIEDLRNRLSSWLCPKCRSNLSIPLVNQLRKGEVIECPFCGVTVGR